MPPLSRRAVLLGGGGAVVAAGLGTAIGVAPGLLRAGARRPPVPLPATGPASVGPSWLTVSETGLRVSGAAFGAARTVALDYGPGERTRAGDIRSDYGARLDAALVPVGDTATRYLHAELPDAVAGQSYAYRWVLDGVAGPAALAHVPAPTGTFRFTAYGDVGTARAASRLLRRVVAARAQVHLVAGDLCYANTGGSGRPSDPYDARQWDRWLSLIAPAAQARPWLTVAGNHEMEDGFGPHGYDGWLSRVPRPGSEVPGCPASWSARFGRLAVLGLDTNDLSTEIPRNAGYTSGAQLAWANARLAAWRAPGSGVDFIVAVHHHSPYSACLAHGSDGGVRQALTPLFDRYAVDLSLSGHNHCYERTHPMRGGSAVDSARRGGETRSDAGTTYLTLGGGGQALAAGFSLPNGQLWTRPGRVEREPAGYSAVAAEQHCLLTADLPPVADGKATLKLSVVSDTGLALDSLTLTRPAA